VTAVPVVPVAPGDVRDLIPDISRRTLTAEPSAVQQGQWNQRHHHRNWKQARSN